MQPIDWEEEAKGGGGGMSREKAGTKRKRKEEMVEGCANLPPQIRQSSKRGQQPQLIWTAGLVLLLAAPLLLISSSNGGGVSAQKSEEKDESPQIEASIDPAPVDGATDEEEWAEAKAMPMEHRKYQQMQQPPMEFIRKFSWEKRFLGANQNNLVEQQKGKGAPENEQYDEVLAARILAEEDVDRLSPAEGGDRMEGAAIPKPVKPIIKPASQLSTAVYPPPSSISPFPSIRSTTKIPPNWSKLPLIPPGKISKQSEGTVALSELDLKSDGELAKIMQRTTLKTREYPVERTSPIVATTPFPFLPSAPTPVPSFLPFPGFIFPHPSHSAQPANIPQNARQNRRSQRPEQFEQLGCGWDFMSQSCKDVFRIGWCQNCVDFGGNNPLFRDCRCTAVTGLYVQTATFLGSSAASARANAAVTAVATNQTSPSSFSNGFAPILAPPLPLLPSLDQLAAPLEVAGRAGGLPSTPASNFLAQTVTPASQVVQALADALRFPQTAMPLLNPISPNSAQFQQPQSANIPLAVPPLLGPPSRAFGTAQFLPPNGAPIIPQFVSQGGNGK